MKAAPREKQPSDNWIEVVSQKVAGLRFGSVHITVHDGKVTQIESVEKTRFVTTREPTSQDR